MTPGPRAKWVAFLLLVAPLGCARSPGTLPPAVPVERAELERALGEVSRQSSSVRRYQGFVRVRGKGPEGGFDARLVVVFERPDRLRVELLGAFGSTRWSAVATERRMKVYFPGQRRYVDDASPENVVSALLGIRLNPDEVMALLSGSGLPVGEREVSEAEGHRQGEILIARVGEHGRIELSEDGQVLRAQTDRFRVTYPTNWKRRRRQIPDEVRIENERLQAALSAEDIDVNVPLAEDVFELEVPEGAERLTAAEIEGEAVFVSTKDP